MAGMPDLVLSIFSGIEEVPLWQGFLHSLLRHTQASQVALFARTVDMPPQAHLRRVVTAERDGRGIDAEALAALGLLHQNSLRPGRVYALEELLEPGTDAHAKREAMARVGIAHGRFLHITAREDQHIWLILLHDRSDFGGADSALLSALAAPLGLAFAMLVASEALKLRANLAEDALARLGVRQTLLDNEGRPLTDFPSAPEPREAPALTRPLAAGLGVLPDRAAKVRVVRQPPRDNRVAAAQVLARELGISDREAALAEALSRGRSIIEAGAELQLTSETARNYTKRIYAKTGASGQADLVRRVLTGIAPLA